MNIKQQLEQVIAEMRAWGYDAEAWASRLSTIVEQMPSASAEPKLSDSQELNRLLTTKDPSWDAWKQTIPEKYWARYDLSAVKLGWSAAMELVLAAPPEPQVPNGMVLVPRELYEAWIGLCYGTDWNNGTHAKKYRKKIERLIAAAKEEGSAS